MTVGQVLTSIDPQGSRHVSLSCPGLRLLLLASGTEERIDTVCSGYGSQLQRWAEPSVVYWSPVCAATKRAEERAMICSLLQRIERLEAQQ